MKNVEEAYNYLGQYALAFAENRQWDEIHCKFQIYTNMAKAHQYLFFNKEKDEKGGFSINSSAMWDGLDAAIFLRDNLCSTTGARIWGLTFTLHPTGKFEIEYDYNKPEGYEETDEIISGTEINQSLNELKNN